MTSSCCDARIIGTDICGDCKEHCGVTAPDLGTILDDLAATLFCMGQDHKPGDGSASKIDGEVDKAKATIKSAILDLYGEALKEAETISEVGDIFRQKVGKL